VAPRHGHVQQWHGNVARGKGGLGWRVYHVGVLGDTNLVPKFKNLQRLERTLLLT
jgi:hypothetical protein